MSDLDRALDFVRTRRWDGIRTSWINNISPRMAVGAAPSGPLSDIPGLTAIGQKLATDRKEAENVVEKTLAQSSREFTDAGARRLTRHRAEVFNRIVGKIQPLEEEISGLRGAVFHEAVFLTHKALHVLGIAEAGVEQGTRTWSLVDAYQSSFFAAKAMLEFCGIVVVEIDNRSVLIDMFPQKTKGFQGIELCEFHYLGHKTDHLAVWKILKRILAITSCDVWPKTAIDKLKTIEDKRFQKQRNDLQYKNGCWFFGDLHSFLTTGSFGDINSWNVDSRDLDADRGDFTLVLAYYLLRCVMCLINDISTDSKKVELELELFRKCAVSARHELYHETIIVPCGSSEIEA